MLKFATAVCLLLAISSAFAQMAISVRSGLIHYAEGQVFMEAAPLTMEFGKFPVVKEGLALATRQGRVELLLNPGVFLRMDENSSVRMLSNSLTNTRVAIEKGVALVEVVELAKENRVAVNVGESETVVLKTGLYRFDASTGHVRVFEGKAVVRSDDQPLDLTRGREATLAPHLLVKKFRTKEKEADSLYAWSQQRAYLVARANISAASSFQSNGYRMSSSGWAYFPGMGLLTFMPSSGYFRGPFGWSYYSPSSVWQYYAPRYNNPESAYGSGGGRQASWGGLGADSSRGSAVPMSSGGDSGVRAAAPAPSAPAVSSPGGARGR
ncbi:MAG TPA: FecR domain-containing protein [Bryobacteraceae bacterium]|nr:FecR domain-containing protein [Bryobacteraceae bacterium]